MDYFELSEDEMTKMGMTVVAWGFSYQVHDGHQSEKFYCDFKFRSGTFNAGYVGADIEMEFTMLNGSVQKYVVKILSTNLSEWKTIPERFGNFIKLAANNWRLNNERTMTVPMINELLNRHSRPIHIEWNREKYFGHFAQCSN